MTLVLTNPNDVFFIVPVEAKVVQEFEAFFGFPISYVHESTVRTTSLSVLGSLDYDSEILTLEEGKKIATVQFIEPVAFHYDTRAILCSGNPPYDRKNIMENSFAVFEKTAVAARYIVGRLSYYSIAPEMKVPAAFYFSILENDRILEDILQKLKDRTFFFKSAGKWSSFFHSWPIHSGSVIDHQILSPPIAKVPYWEFKKLWMQPLFIIPRTSGNPSLALADIINQTPDIWDDDTRFFFFSVKFVTNTSFWSTFELTIWIPASPPT